MIVQYVAFDGKKFDNEKACAKYESDKKSEVEKEVEAIVDCMFNEVDMSEFFLQFGSSHSDSTENVQICNLFKKYFCQYVDTYLTEFNAWQKEDFEE